MTRVGPAAEGQGSDPIVIVGMGCRLPGNVKTPSQLWDILEARRSTQSDVPKNRFDIHQWYHPDPKRKGGIGSMGGYFLGDDDGYREFDPSFFGIHSLEAASMDPQQRKLLEVVYETFESAGLTLDQVSNTVTACYIGAFTADFNKTLTRDIEEHVAYESTGSDMTVLSNRINYVFNLKGPSLTVDTACSSSLYALHLACQSLQLGDCNAAVVGGTNIIMDVMHQLNATKLGILSPTSTCHTFDERADGFGRAEGITALYLKRLSDALANRDPIRAVIRATAINTNGKGNGISHPGAAGQEQVIRRAYSKAGLGFDETGFVECHGTGTPVGDPIEVEAIGNVFAEGRTPHSPLLLGALKTNIGHTEGASGVASIQKVVLSLEKGIIPATYGVERLNPAINFREGRLKVACTAVPWPKDLRYWRAGVNSFGYGGANAHVILDSTQSYFSSLTTPIPQSWTFLEARDLPETAPWQSLTVPVRKADVMVNGISHHKHDGKLSGTGRSKGNGDTGSSTQKFLLISSSRSQATLQKVVGALQNVVSRCNISDLAYTLSVRRSIFDHRAFIIVPKVVIASAVGFENWTQGVQKGTPPVLAFAFTGQGAQWPRMGLELVSYFPIVRRTFETLQGALDTCEEGPDWTLLSALSHAPESSRMMTDVTVTVTLCTAIQVALVDLLESWGVRPKALVGHSSGEAAAAYASGLLTASEAIITSYYRALALVKCHEPGAMMAVGLGAVEAEKYIAAHDNLFIACHNSPESITISGKVNAIDKLGSTLREAGIFARKVMSSGNANHSPMVARAADYFVANFKDSLPDSKVLSRRTAKATMYSCITADVVGGRDVGIEYWGRNISDPVLFNQATQKLLQTEHEIDHIIEIGPHSALAGPIRQMKSLLGFSNDRMAYSPSLIRGSDGVNDLLRLAGSLFLAGYPIDLAMINSAEVVQQDDIEEQAGRLVVDLPPYQWTYDELHWVEGRLTRELRFRKHRRHDLLGSREPGTSLNSPMWRNKLQLKDVPWVADHQIGTTVLFPASGYIAMAIEAIRQIASDQGLTPSAVTVQGVSIVSPIVLAGREVVETILNLRSLNTSSSRGSSKWFDFRISSVSMEDKWSEHASGMITFNASDKGVIQPISGLQSQMTIDCSTGSHHDWYSKFAELGLNYGPAFQTLRNIRSPTEGHATAQILLHSTKEVMQYQSSYLVHPATLDGCLQLSFVAALGAVDCVSRAYLPFEIRSMTLWNRPDLLEDFSIVEGQGNICGLRTVESNFKVIRSNGDPLVQANVIFASVEGGFGTTKEEIVPQPYQRLVWLPDIDSLQGSMTTGDFLQITSPTSSEVINKDSQKLRRFVQGLKILNESNKGTARMPGLSIEPLQLSESDFKCARTLMGLHNLISLIAHKSPGLRILEIGSTPDLVTATTISAAGGRALYPAYSQYTFASDEVGDSQDFSDCFRNVKNVKGLAIDFDEDFATQGLLEKSVDLLILKFCPESQSTVLPDYLENLGALLAPKGRVVLIDNCGSANLELMIFGAVKARTPTEEVSDQPPVTRGRWKRSLLEAASAGVQLEIGNDAIILSTHRRDPADGILQNTTVKSLPEPLWIIHRSLSREFLQSIKTTALGVNIPTRQLQFSNYQSIPKGAHTMMLAEAEEPLLSRTSEFELTALDFIFRQASSMIWVTNADLKNGKKPELSLIQGMAKVIRTEYPNLLLSLFDIDDSYNSSGIATILMQQELRMRQSEASSNEKNIFLRKGVPNVSRYVMDEHENLNDQKLTSPTVLEGRFEPGLSLDMLSVGQIGSYFFKESKANPQGDKAISDEVIISPRLYGLSKMEAATLRGQTMSSSFSHEGIGVVSHVLRAKSAFKIGDTVVFLKPGKFDSEPAVSEKLCRRISEGDESLFGLLYPFCTAFHALEDLGRVRKHDVVFVDFPDDILSAAICRVAQSLGAKALAVFASEAEKTHLEHNCGLPKDALIPADTNDLHGILMRCTSGRGVNVVVSGATSLDLRTVWGCLALGGRFVLAGSNTKPDLHLLDPVTFLRGASFSSFNLSEMLLSDPEEVSGLIDRSFALLRAAPAPLLYPLTRFDLSQLETAVQTVAQNEGYHRIGLSCRPEMSIRVRRMPRSPLIFPGDSGYLLVGCLGGLGRSLAIWMKDRGAKNFVFLSRSGDDKPQAAALVQDLRASDKNISVQVIRGDVTKREDVDRAISSAEKPLRGVIQAAVVFKDSLFSSMSLEAFNEVVQPKVQGTINLHKATLELEAPLDFFVMTSSTIGMVGTSTQSHYAAANAFLDSMARHRWSLGLEATSLSLGMVTSIGHVHENAEIEKALRKRGSYGISEGEYLRMMELACRPRKQTADTANSVWRNFDALAGSHIVTALDPTKLRVKRAAGGSANMIPEWIRTDPRLSQVTNAVAQLSSSPTSLRDTSTSRKNDPTTNTNLRSLLSRGPDVVAVTSPPVRAAVQSMVLHKLSALVLVPVDKLSAMLRRPLLELGMDSIIGAEFRAWAWRELKAELSFMQVLEGGRSLDWLVETVFAGVGWDDLR